MSFPSYYHYQQQLRPACSFSGAVLHNCTINVFHGPQVQQQSGD